MPVGGMIEFLASVGAAFLGFVAAAGRVAVFAGGALAAGFTPPYYPRLIARQIIYMGYFSLPVVGLTALFTGMVLALQSYTGFSRFNAESAIATEIGTMRVTEQIDALTTLSTDPLRYLVLPRLLAGLVTLPVLVLVADIIGVFGGFLVGSYKLNFNPVSYLTQTERYLETMDVVSGLVKAAVFGFIVALMGCYHGYYSRGGAEGVGQATTQAVVSASILILLFNYILTQTFFSS